MGSFSSKNNRFNKVVFFYLLILTQIPLVFDPSLNFQNNCLTGINELGELRTDLFIDQASYEGNITPHADTISGEEINFDNFQDSRISSRSFVTPKIKIINPSSFEYRSYFQHPLPITDYIGVKTLLSGADDVLSIDFCPNGSLVAAATLTSVIKVWNVTTGTSMYNFTNHQASVRSVDFHPNGSLLVSGSTDDTIRIWDMISGTERAKITVSGVDILSVAFSPNGSLLASGSNDNKVRIWNLDTGKNLTLEDHSSFVFHVVFNSNSSLLASGASDNVVIWWDVNTGLPVDSFPGFSVAFAPDDTVFASGGRDDIIRIWDLQTRSSLENLSGHLGDISSVNFSPDGQLLLSGSADTSIKLWDVNTWQIVQNLTGHEGDVQSAVFGDKGKTLFSGSRDDSVKCWNLTLGHEIKTLSYHNFGILAVDYHPNGSILASGGLESNIILWNLSSNSPVFPPLSGHGGTIYSLKFSPDREILASGSQDKTIRLWNVKTGAQIDILEGHMSYVTSLAFNPEGTLLVSGSSDSSAKLWNVDNGENIFNLTGFSGPVTSVDFSPDGKMIASGSMDSNITLWNATDGTFLKQLSRHSERVNSVKFGENSDILISSSDDNNVTFWDVTSGETIRNLTAHTDDVRTLAFTSDFKVLGTCSEDQSIRLWNATTGTLIRTLPGSDSTIYSIAFSPDGSTLVSSYLGTGDLKLWSSGISMFQFTREILLVTPVNYSLEFFSNSEAFLEATWDGAPFQDITGTTSIQAPPDYGFHDLTIGVTHFSGKFSKTYTFLIADSWDDFDGDGIPNIWEEINGTNSLDDSDSLVDSDRDGLVNLEEFFHKTFPLNPDSDNDGWYDGSEVSNTSDPLDPNPPPFVTWSGSFTQINDSIVDNSTWTWGVNSTNAFSLDIWVNQVHQSTHHRLSSTEFSWTLDLDEDLNIITYRFYYDDSRNSTTIIFRIILDTAPPSFEFVNPKPGAVLQSKSIITVTIANYTDLLFYWDEGNYTSYTKLLEFSEMSRSPSLHFKNLFSGSSKNRTFELPPEDGPHTLYLMAVDSVGNIDYAEYSFITDDTDPTAIIQGIDPVMFGERLVRVIPEDVNNISHVEFELSGKIIHTDNTTPYRWEWDTAKTLDGIYLIRIHVYDIAGNKYSKSYPNIFVVNNLGAFLFQVGVNNYQVFGIILLIIVIIILILLFRRQIHIHYLYANPKSNLLEFSPEFEYSILKESIEKEKYGRRIKLEPEGALTKEKLIDQLRSKFKPHVVQFSGHGVPGYLLLIDSKKSRLGEAVPAGPISKAFRDHKNRIRIVILRSCYSEEVANSLKEHIDFVIGMSKEVLDDAARKFCIGFLTYLAAGETVKDAFDKGITEIELIKNYGGDIPKLKCRNGVNPAKARLLRCIFRDLFCFFR